MITKLMHSGPMPETARTPHFFHARPRLKRALCSAAGMGLLALALSACAPTGPEPVALDQNPGQADAPSGS